MNEINNILIFVNKITIIVNSINTKRGYLYDVIGIHVRFTPLHNNIALLLSDCNFDHINAQVILHVTLLPVYSRITIWVKNRDFHYNTYIAVYSKLRRPIVTFDILEFTVSLLFTDYNFINNTNELSLIFVSIIKQVLGYGFTNCISTSYIQIKDCLFARNIGSLVDITGNKQSDCIAHFTMINPTVMRNIPLKQPYIIIFQHVAVNISGAATFSYTAFARSIILFYFCTVTFHKNITFINNGFNINITDSYSMDNVITLHSDSPYSQVMENTNVTGFVKTVPIGTTIEIHFMA